MKLLRVRALAAAAAMVAISAVSLQAQAAENGLQRYSPGIGGSDMTSPLVPGWYFQTPLVHYHANKLKGNDGEAATIGTPVTGYGAAGLAARTEVKAKATNIAALPRLTYLSPTQFWGANIGWTAMLPLVKRRVTFEGVATHLGSNTIAVPAQYQAGISGLTSKDTGIGDLELSPLMHWEIGDHQTVTFTPTIVIPTGDYKATQRANPGYGNYYTFRPSVQYAFIGDGWDIGVRNVLSFNTRNKDTGYLSGKIYNMDFQLMKFVSEDVRFGLQGYFVRQLSADTYDATRAVYPNTLTPYNLTDGNKMSVNAVGPALAWLKNGGDMLVEGKVLKEYQARNRFEGTAIWFTVSKPL